MPVAATTRQTASQRASGERRTSAILRPPAGGAQRGRADLQHSRSAVSGLQPGGLFENSNRLGGIELLAPDHFAVVVQKKFDLVSKLEL